MLKVYLDESGIHDGSPIVTVGAYIGRPKVWRDWTKRWVREIRPIKVYHATDAQNLSGEFENWTPEGVGALAQKILPIITETEIAGLAVGMDLRLFEDAMKGRDDLRAIFGTPYIACVQWAMQIILNIAFSVRNDERIAFVHENNSYHGQVMDAFNWMKVHSNRGNNAISLTFGTKKDYPPLQTADILAYEANKRLRSPTTPPRRPWVALRANTFTATYGLHNMGELIGTLEKIRDGRLDEVPNGMGWNRAWGDPAMQRRFGQPS